MLHLWQSGGGEMSWMNKQTNYPYHVYIAIVLVFGGFAVYGALWLDQFSRPDVRAMGVGKRMSEAIDEYQFAHGEFPPELAMVQPYMHKVRWPDNPIKGQPIVDTKSPVFTSTSSPGNVYYERLIEGGGFSGYDSVLADERQVGYILHVFGEEDEVWTYKHSARFAGPVSN